jgi:tetratricopeptide (TPR) repeat protein
MQTNIAGPVGSFSRATNQPGSWLAQNKNLVIRLSVVIALFALVIIAGSIWASNQSKKAIAAFNAAMDVYDAPLTQPGQPPVPNVTMYANAAARAKVAYPLFRSTADKYGWFEQGKNSEYFAGLTASDMGDTADAEKALKTASSMHDDTISSLARMALAGLYAQTNRQGEAVKQYEYVIDHPTTAVSASAARLALAGLEETTNPQKARELYAKIKDNNKATVAGEIATQKLSGK